MSTDIEIEHFVDSILEIQNEKEKREAINKISSAEKNIAGYSNNKTIDNQNHRDFAYRDDLKREELRKKVLKELIDKKRLNDDDKISLGRGGAKPNSDVKNEKKFFYVIGPPASGKSFISNLIADSYGAYIVDADYAKRKLPEFKKDGGATLVHEESSLIVFSDTKNETLMSFCIKNEYNIVMPKIGHDIEELKSFTKAMKNSGYNTYLVLIDLDRKFATQRAYQRFKETNRYIPLPIIFDQYANDPQLNFFKLKQSNSDETFVGFAHISTDVKKGEKPILVEEQNLNKFKDIFRKGE